MTLVRSSGELALSLLGKRVALLGGAMHSPYRTLGADGLKDGDHIVGGTYIGNHLYDFKATPKKS